MATFSDLCSLLLTFFVLLLSFANMDAKEFREMLGSAREAFGVQKKHHGHISGLTTSLIEWSDQESEPWTAMTSKEAAALSSVAKEVEKRGLTDEMEVEINDRGVVIRMKDRLAFKPGSDELNDRVKPVLDKVAEMIGAFPNGLSIEGHTDNRPISTPRFPSNWELSSARASATLRYMERNKKLEVKELHVTGHGDRKPVVPNDTDEHRAMNRRVEFVFERDDPDKKKTLADIKPDLGTGKPMVKLEPIREGDDPKGTVIGYRVLPTTADSAAIEVEKKAAEAAEKLAPSDAGVLDLQAVDAGPAKPLPLDHPSRMGRRIDEPSQTAVWKEQLKVLREQHKKELEKGKKARP